MVHGSSQSRSIRKPNKTGVARASKTSIRVRVCTLYCYCRDMLLFHSRQRKRMHGIRPKGNNECDELSTLSLRISRPFKRQRKGRERELEAPRNKWKVISMNNAGRPARSSLSLRLRPAATTNGNCRISARYPKSKRICREETPHRNRSVQLCSLQSRIKISILALSQKGDISEMFLG